MLFPTLFMMLLAVILTVIAWQKGGAEHITGFKNAIVMAVSIFPLIVFAFIVAGMIQAILPHELISRWIGAESGFKGILIGTVAGAFTPGGPYVTLPLAALFLKSGASVGTMVAYITSWSLLAFSRIPIEIGILGWRFAVMRFASTLFLPVIAGLVAQVISHIAR